MSLYLNGSGAQDTLSQNRENAASALLCGTSEAVLITFTGFAIEISNAENVNRAALGVAVKARRALVLDWLRRLARASRRRLSARRVAAGLAGGRVATGLAGGRVGTRSRRSRIATAIRRGRVADRSSICAEKRLASHRNNTALRLLTGRTGKATRTSRCGFAVKISNAKNVNRAALRVGIETAGRAFISARRVGRVTARSR